MVTTSTVDRAAIGSAAQELEVGAGKASGAMAPAMSSATGLTPRTPATVMAAAPSYKVMPRSAAWTPQAGAFAPATSGYAGASAASTPPATAAKALTATATKATTAKSTTKKATTTKATTAKSTAAKELAFLDDPALSIQDKLYQFMALQMKKSNQALKDAMLEYEGKRTESAAKQTAAKTSTSGASSGSSTPAKKSSGGGLFGMLGDALGGIADAVVGGAESLAKDLGGPLLAAGCTAVGLPFLAPVALQIGGTIGKAAVGGVASMVGKAASSLFGGSSQEVGEAVLGPAVAASGGGSTSATATAAKALSSTSTGTTTAKASSSTTTKASSTTSKAAASEGDDFDERVEAMNLQRLVEKQQAMFGLLSNALKAMHDTQMNAIQNLR
jgi:hypothetical protein